MEIESQCLVCDEPFTGRPNKLYCSGRCRKAAQRQRVRRRQLEARRGILVRLCQMARKQRNLPMEYLHKGRLARLDAELKVLQF